MVENLWVTAVIMYNIYITIYNPTHIGVKLHSFITGFWTPPGGTKKNSQHLRAKDATGLVGWDAVSR